MKDIVSEIISRVRAEIKIQAETVTAGINVNSFDDYKQYVGTIQGLSSVLDIIDEILTEDDEQDL
jgi:hypothetical protein